MGYAYQKIDNRNEKQGEVTGAVGKLEPKRAYSVTEFCELYGIGRSKAYDEMKAGRLKYRKCGRRRLIGEDDARDWFDALQQ